MYQRLVGALASHPFLQFTRSRYFYAWYDGCYLALALAAIVALRLAGTTGVLGAPQWWWLAAAPLLTFALIWCHLIIHNCVHGNLPKWINRLAGEVLGVLVIVRFASWAVIHIRHHRHSDDRDTDPHPNLPGYFRTVWHTIVNVERQLFRQYYDVWGDTPASRRYERGRSLVSYTVNAAIVAAWVVLLGPWFAAVVFLPANLLAGLFVIHFNWSTHNGERGRSDDDFQPVNLNHGYYRLGNRLFAGIYMHKNHHARPHLFNPLRWREQDFGRMDAPIDGP